MKWHVGCSNSVSTKGFKLLQPPSFQENGSWFPAAKCPIFVIGSLSEGEPEPSMLSNSKASASSKWSQMSLNPNPEILLHPPYLMRQKTLVGIWLEASSSWKCVWKGAMFSKARDLLTEWILLSFFSFSFYC